MAQSNTSTQESQKYLLSPRGAMTIEVPQNEEITDGKNGGRKGVSSAICQRRANRGSINIKK